MSVIVTGMKMPDKCSACLFSQEEDCAWYACSLLNGSIFYLSAEAERIEECPLVEEKLGHWIIGEKTNVYGGKEIICSECGGSFTVSPSIMGSLYDEERYCKFCGAKMEKKGIEL